MLSRRLARSLSTLPGEMDGGKLASWRHALHRRPEVAFEEVETSAFVVEKLDRSFLIPTQLSLLLK